MGLGWLQWQLHTSTRRDSQSAPSGLVRPHFLVLFELSFPSSPSTLCSSSGLEMSSSGLSPSLSHIHTHTQRRIRLFSWVLEVILGCGRNSTAEKKNIPWREMTKEILKSDVYKELERIQNPSLVYPDCNSLFHQCPISFPFGLYQFFFLVKLNYMIKFSIY